MHRDMRHALHLVFHAEKVLLVEAKFHFWGKGMNFQENYEKFQIDEDTLEPHVNFQLCKKSEKYQKEAEMFHWINIYLELHLNAETGEFGHQNEEAEVFLLHWSLFEIQRTRKFDVTVEKNEEILSEAIILAV